MMDPNLLRILASGAYPSPLPSPQESPLNMAFPLQLSPQLIQQQMVRQQLLACQQLLYQQAYSSLLLPTLPSSLKVVSPTTPQQLFFPAKFIEPVVPEESEPPPKLSPVASLSSQTLAAVLSSPPTSAVKPPESPKPTAKQESHCSSPSTSAQNKEDEEEDLFVDVESVDSKIANRDRRKAHVEYFRKIKSIRQRSVTNSSGERFLQCAICNEKIPMQDNAIQIHVNLHADAGGFRCQVCGFEMREKCKVYRHMRDRHPTKTEMIEDRRNILKLCAYIEVVFPRAVAKTKKESTKEVEQLIGRLEQKKMPEVSCSICEKMVIATKNALTRHAGSHPWYRCKTCKYTTDSEQDQEQHLMKEHAVPTPRLTVEYNLCTAIDVVARQVTRCFSHALQCQATAPCHDIQPCPQLYPRAQCPLVPYQVIL